MHAGWVKAAMAGITFLAPKITGERLSGRFLGAEAFYNQFFLNHRMLTPGVDVCGIAVS